MPDITLQSVTGIVDPKIDINVDPITVEGIPDFLKDDVNLDLENPYIKLKLENGSPADVNLKARMTWTKDGVFNEGFQIGTNINENTDQTITLSGNATSEYYLSRIAMNNLPAGAKNIVLGDNLYNLIRNIPDEIKLTDVEAKALQHDTEVILGNDGANYEVNTIYELNAPLQFGNELNIVYKDTINDWGGDLEDITIKKAIVEMDALNGIPLNFELNAQAIDRNGNVYPNVTVNPVKNTIAPGLKLTGENGGKSYSIGNRMRKRRHERPRRTDCQLHGQHGRCQPKCHAEQRHDTETLQYPYPHQRRSNGRLELISHFYNGIKL